MCSTAFGLIKFSLESRSMPVIAFDVYVDPISLWCIFSSLERTKSRSSSLWVQKSGFNLLPRLTATRLEAAAGCTSYFNYVAPNSCTRHEIHVIPWAVPSRERAPNLKVGLNEIRVCTVADRRLKPTSLPDIKPFS